MQNRDFGVAFTETGYRFYTYDYQTLQWLPPLNDEMFNEHMLDESYMMTLRLDDRDVTLEPEFETDFYDVDDFDEREIEPQLLLLATGEITPFAVAFVRDLDPTGFAVSGALTGDLELSRYGDDVP